MSNDWWSLCVERLEETRPSSGLSSKPIIPILTGWPTPPLTGSTSEDARRGLVRANLMIAATHGEADQIKKKYPQFRYHLAVTPRTLPSGIAVGEYVWTPSASALPARLRMAIRVALAPLIDEDSVEETFPDTLLSW